MSETIGSIAYVAGGAIQAAVYSLYPESLTTELASEMLRLQAEAARVELEENTDPDGWVPGITVFDYMHPNSIDSINDFHRSVIDDMDANGSIYTGIFINGHMLPKLGEYDELFNERDLVAWARLRTIEASMRDEALIEQVVVHPFLQRQGLGSAALHGGLVMGNFDPEGRVAARVLVDDNSTRSFLEKTVGLERRYDIDPPDYILGHHNNDMQIKLARAWYETPPLLGLRGVIDRIEKRKPWLGTYLTHPGPDQY